MENKTFMSVQEVADEPGVSRSYAYKVVKQLNGALKKLGNLTAAGRVNTQYFHRKLCYSEQAQIIVQKGENKMAVYKDGDKWRAVFRFTNWKGERKQTQKCEFTTKREAQMWEREELLKQGSKLDMTFANFFEICEEDKKTGEGEHMGTEEDSFYHISEAE